MKRIVNSIKWVAAGCLAAVAGCQSGTGTKPAEPASSSRGDVMDIRPLETSTPAYQPVQQQPVYQPVAAQPVSYEIPVGTPAVSTTPASAGNKHVVKRGETLYSIARQSYGDGKQWTKIASANPGVSPSSLKVGQTLMVP